MADRLVRLRPRYAAPIVAGCLWLCASLYCIAAWPAGVATPDTAGSRIVVPIDQTVLSDGAIRYSIAMRINGQMLQVMLDSGSTGLRLMPAAVDRLHLKPGRIATPYRFGSGVVLRGSPVKVAVSIGGAAPAAILAQAASFVSCSYEQPMCPARGVMSDRYRIGADSADELISHGFLAILGIGLRPADIPNPLTVIGRGRWIIDLPRPAERHPGRLILDPGDKELEAYKVFPLEPERVESRAGLAAGWRDTIPGCLREKDEHRAFCRPMLLDTGATGFQVVTTQVHGHTRWPVGSKVVLVLEPPADGSGVGFEFRSGRLPATTVFVDPSFPDSSGDPPPINCGVMPYYYFSVAYDALRGVIALKVRAPVDGAASTQTSHTRHGTL